MVFFGFGVEAPWPESFPKGRVIRSEDRHATIAFLGNVPAERLLEIMDGCPLFPFKVGPVGVFSKCLFLPKESKPNVAAWEVEWINYEADIDGYRYVFIEWLKAQGYDLDKEKREWLAHVTLSRQPLDRYAWRENFQKLPLFVHSFNLYESLGHSIYRVIWSKPLMAPFEEIEHTADIAFIIRGTSILDLYIHAQIALAFKCPSLLSFMNINPVKSLDDIIMSLNNIISEIDKMIGCSFKAISFHGNIKTVDSILTWEMIVDV